MKYYISETPLKLREYGRNVQSMIEYALTVEDRDDRTKIARNIIRIMATLTPSLKENPDYEQKLWDALFIISDFKLDVDAPYPPPPREHVIGYTRDRMEYYRGKPKYKHYGKNVELMIAKASEMEPGPKRDAYINNIANTMKLFLRNMDREGTSEETITEHMRELSNGAIDVKAADLTFHKLTGVGLPNDHQGGRSNNKGRGRSNNKKRSGGRGKRKRKP